ncbi:MAG: hypothetical protein LUH63_11800 [Parabacteroides sp.]|nr:hypothetical protein [Parabacteroides sp.]
MKREKKEITVYTVQETCLNEVFYAEERIKAGFPSPAEDYLQETIDLNKVLVPNPGNTFVVVAERGMTGEKCIEMGNLLVFEQFLKPNSNDLIAYISDGEFLIGRVNLIDEYESQLIGVLIATIRLYESHFFHNIDSLPVLPEDMVGLPSFVKTRVMGKIDLNRILIKNPPVTFVTMADGDSMVEDCIEDGNLLIIDKSIDPYDGCLAACYLNGEFTLKKVKVENGEAWLLPSNPDYPVIRLVEEDHFMVWGILVSNIKQFRYGRRNGRTG